jgi:hypothetical protein
MQAESGDFEEFSWLVASSQTPRTALIVPNEIAFPSAGNPVKMTECPICQFQFRSKLFTGGLLR